MAFALLSGFFLDNPVQISIPDSRVPSSSLLLYVAGLPLNGTQLVTGSLISAVSFYESASFDVPPPPF